MLPLVYGDALAGRVEAAADTANSVLRVKNIWFEDGVRRTKALQTAVEKCMQRLAHFNGCGTAEGLTDL